MWESYTLIFRVGLYLALSGLVGAAFSLLFSQSALLKNHLSLGFHTHLRPYFFISLGSVLITSLGYFWIRVGAFAEEGLSGLFDPLMISILYDSGLGKALNYALLTCLFSLLFYRLSHSRYPLWLKCFMFTLMLINISLSFMFTGHTADFTLVARSVLALHILIAFLWLGSLYPLWLFVRLEKADMSKQLLERFGVYASFAVPVLVLAGVGLIYLISRFELPLLMSNWGGFLLVKLAMVVGILGIAAWHKYKLVPHFLHKKGAEKMASSLKREILIGLSILTTTGVLSTLVSP
ncbi:MAG: copper resistance D family protein [Marinomonas sp.]